MPTISQKYVFSRGTLGRFLKEKKWTNISYLTPISLDNMPTVLKNTRRVWYQKTRKVLEKYSKSTQKIDKNYSKSLSENVIMIFFELDTISTYQNMFALRTTYVLS